MIRSPGDPHRHQSRHVGRRLRRRAEQPTVGEGARRDRAVGSGCPRARTGRVSARGSRRRSATILSSRSLTSVGRSSSTTSTTRVRRPDPCARRTGQPARSRPSGGGVLVIIDRPDDVRVRTAGRSAVAPRLDDDRWRSMLEQIERGRRRCPRPRAASGRPSSRRGLHRVRGRGRAAGRRTPISTCASTPVTSRTPASIRWRPSSATPIASVTCTSRTSAPTFSLASMPRSSPSGKPSRPASSARSERGSSTSAPCSTRSTRAHFDGHATIEQDRVPGTGEPLDDLRQSLAVLDHVSRA